MLNDNVIKQQISIHALREESDHKMLIAGPSKAGFQSTLSVRRATSGKLAILVNTDNFNPRSP